jgi:hypothetical protein
MRVHVYSTAFNLNLASFSTTKKSRKVVRAPEQDADGLDSTLGEVVKGLHFFLAQ